MYSNLLISFIILHVLGDYYLQTDTIIEKKVTKYRYVLLQSIIYAAVFRWYYNYLVTGNSYSSLSSIIMALYNRFYKAYISKEK